MNDNLDDPHENRQDGNCEPDAEFPGDDVVGRAVFVVAVDFAIGEKGLESSWDWGEREGGGGRGGYQCSLLTRVGGVDSNGSGAAGPYQWRVGGMFGFQVCCSMGDGKGKKDVRAVFLDIEMYRHKRYLAESIRVQAVYFRSPDIFYKEAGSTAAGHVQPSSRGAQPL